MISICDLSPQLGHKLVASILVGGHAYQACILDPGDSFTGISNMIMALVEESKMKHFLTIENDLITALEQEHIFQTR